MRLRFGALILLAAFASAAPAEPGATVDPLAVVAALDRYAERELWPGFDATAFPIALYDGNRTLLLRHPSPPPEFARSKEHEDVWVFSGRHQAMRWNSNAEIGGVRTATLLLTIDPSRSADVEASILFHEVFHLFSKSRHPSWRPNELDRYSYPMTDIDNYRLLLIEEEALARAMESESTAGTAAWAATALATRTARQARLSDEHRAFETALELQEGTAVYMARSALGTAAETARLREDRGPEGIRWRCYETGAAIAVALDRLLPSWKRDLDTRPETTFTELLATAVAAVEPKVEPATFSDSDLDAIARRAKLAVDMLINKRKAMVDAFARHPRRIVVRVSDGGEPFRITRFDPLGVEVLGGGEAFQSHYLTAVHPRGEVNLTNPRYTRQSLDGVLALTASIGTHPLRDGVRRIVIAGFTDEPTVTREGDSVRVEAEGLNLSFDRADVASKRGEIVVSVPPVENER